MPVPPPRIGSAVLGAAFFLTVAGPQALARPETGAHPAPALRGPAGGSVTEEREVVLSWQSRGTEHVVFVSTSSLEGRRVEDLLADPAVLRARTVASSIPLTDLVRGSEGETGYWWAVASRASETAEWQLSAPARFRARKTYRSVTEQSARPIREVRRGRASPAAAPDRAEVRLSSGLRFDPLAGGVPPVAAALRAGALAPDERGGFLVQLAGPIAPGQREALESAGALVVSYFPDYAYLVRMTPRERSAVAALPFVRWVGRHHPAYKVSPLTQSAGRATQAESELVVLLYPDADLSQARDELRAQGLQVLEATDSGRNRILVVRGQGSPVNALAQRDDVAWVEPKLALRLVNATAQWVVQTFQNNNRRIWTMGIRGQGQVVHTSDSGVRTSHDAFRDGAISITDYGDFPGHRKIIAYKPTLPGVLFGDTSGASYHGTHTAGTVLGNDAPFGFNQNDGMAPDAKLFFHDGGNTANSIVAPADLNLMFGEAYADNGGGGARLSSNSWSAGTNGEYTVLDMTADQFMWDHQDMLIFFSTGNSSAPATVGSPATCKNGVGSGATTNGPNATTTAYFTSQGPTQDGRTKPTVMAPGSGIISANGNGDTGYKSLSGTSMSCPAKTGATALIRQYYVDGWYPTGAPVPANGFYPSGALLKASAISSTDNDMTGFNIPNTSVGWGRINLDNMLYFPNDLERMAVVDESSGLTTGEFVEYEISVTDANAPLKITLCWSDKEGMPGAATQLVNDLNLTVTDPTGIVSYLGNVFAAGESIPGGAADAINVEEGVRRNTPSLGIWTVRVDGANVPFGPQPFAIAISGGVGEVAGIVKIDRLTYGRSDFIDLRVEDTNASSPVTVTISSDTEPGEVISVPGSNGVFQAIVPTTALEPTGSDGVLSLSHLDAITVSYTDANPSATVTASATADFTGPVITNVGAAAVGPTESITWDTDVVASARVYYGTSPSLGQTSFLDPLYLTSHEIALTGLLPETDYWFDVESIDRTGNVTLDDAGGSHYRFTTGRKGEILLVVGDASFTAVNTYVDAFLASEWNFDVLDVNTANPPLGDSSGGMRSYAVVWWQVGHEQYPPFEDSARDSLSAYLDGGGRLSVVSHDVGWAFGDPGSGFWTAARENWVNNYLHANWLEDPLTWPVVLGAAGDPISDAYQTGQPYLPHREGAAGDEMAIVAGTGTGSYVWSNTDATPDNIAVRWENSVNDGTPGVGVWGGTPTKTVGNFMEFTGIVDVTSRNDIVDKTAIWLIGRDHPDVDITSPDIQDQVFTTNTIPIVWTESTYGGTLVSARALEYSSDGGASWNLITTTPAVVGAHTWDVTGVPNGSNYHVRATAADDGQPPLAGGHTSVRFTIDRAGGDLLGPVVHAGSITSDPNPMDNRNSTSIQAVASDDGRGNANIAAAEWSWGPQAAAAGSGTAMSGPFSQVTESVTGTIPSGVVPAGEQTVWVRARDAAGIWGPPTGQVFFVNGDALGVGVAAATPLRFALHQNAPNPFSSGTTIRFALPQATDVDLSVYNVAGKKVRTLVSGREGAGHMVYSWDGRNDTGRRVTSGVYFYRIQAGKFDATRKMVLMK